MNYSFLHYYYEGKIIDKEFAVPLAKPFNVLNSQNSNYL
jgi:hypothetical protein